MQADDPPYLPVGTAVSAKYKGAFCEAKVSKVVRMVKCKVTYKMGLGNATVTDIDIKGTLRVGQLVQAKHSDKKDLVDATIMKIQDCSQYTVVFDDGDITTLRRTALCLKSGRHFNESETLDQLPLTHPEHFGNPVVGGRRGRRNRQLKDESSDEEIEEENEPDLEGYTQDIGRVVSVESTEKKRNKENWFPGLIVIPSAQPTVRINIKDEFLVRSFKDGRYYTVPKKEISEFNRDTAEKVDSPGLSDAVQRAIKFLDDNELPLYWEKSSLFNSSVDSDSENNNSDTSDDEPSEEKDRFVAQLYKFMDDSGTPLNRTPTISNKDIDLHRLFRVVHKLGGYNRVTNQNKWRSVTIRLKLPTNQNTFNQVKSVYKKCLLSYESFHRTLGVTMLNHTRSSKKNTNRGRSLIRDKDRITPVNSPKPEKEEEREPEKTEEKKEQLDKPEPKAKKKIELKEEKKIKIEEMSDTNSDATDLSESVASTSGTGRPKRTESKPEIQKPAKDKKIRSMQGDKVKILIERFEEPKKAEEEKVQQTRSKSQFNPKVKEVVPVPEKKPEPKQIKETVPLKTVKSVKKPPNPEEEKKRGRKRLTTEEKTSDATEVPQCNVNIGDKLKVFYGPTNESKVTYEAKVIEVDRDQTGPIYLVHYTGWNTRYDEWIPAIRIAENLSATTKAKRLKQNVLSTSKATAAKIAGKRGRGASISGRSAGTEIPRSTTPSSVTSSSSRTKSPATPATRSSRLTARQDSSRRTRRASAHTDVSIHSDSESDVSESESELTRTRSGIKQEETEVKTYKRKITKPSATPRPEKRNIKEDEDTEKEEEEEKPMKRTRRTKKASAQSTEESDDDSTNPPKGRDFDLNQIRSELKGFTKLKVPAVDNLDKDASSSDDSTNPPPIIKEEVKEEHEEDKPTLEKSSSSEDIYEFKEPEPFEFETRSKLVDDKNVKKRLPRLFEDIDKTSKKKTPPRRTEKQDSSAEKKIFSRRTPLRKLDESEEEDDVVVEVKKEEDPFDKLVGSPSFNLVKTTPEKSTEEPANPLTNILEEPLSLFRELPETAEDYSEDMELSDCESQTQIFTRDELFPNTFSKPSPDRNTLDLEFSSGKTDEGKTTNSDDDDMIMAQIQRVIAQSSSSDDSNDALLVSKPSTSFQAKILEEPKPPTTILGMSTTTLIIETPKVTKEEVKEPEVEPKREPTPTVTEKSIFSIVKQTISPALQETDSSLLDSFVAQPPMLPMLLNQKLDETAKELSVKTGTKIADSILQKFNSIKNQIEGKTSKPETCTENVDKKEVKIETTKEQKEEVKVVDELKSPVVEEEPEVETKPEETVKPEVKKPDSPEPKFEIVPEIKKRRRVISKAFIEETDSDSSDSEQLVIARSDEDSQTNSFDNKIMPECKESENSNISAQTITDDSQSQSQPEERNFKFDDINIEKDTVETKEELPIPVKQEENIADADQNKETNEPEPEPSKEEEEDPHLHSLLLCEEEIPRSPAPASEPVIPVEPKSSKSVHEMPFASAPGTSNSKMLLEPKKAHPPPLLIPVERENRVVDAQAVLDNTPPTTPESTVSNLSPRGENGGISPNTADNESCKSNEGEPEYRLQRRNSSLKVSPYSEEDTQMTSEPPMKKSRDDLMPAMCKKRRKSLRNSDDVPIKRGRKPLNRSRHNSDSDDTSEHSNTGSVHINVYDRSARSPRPSKYNFFVEFDPSLDSGQRIAVLQQKLSELRKTYADVKAELAAVERRRKKIRRREREALKAAKQDMACA